jgi:hypothetical protein
MGLRDCLGTRRGRCSENVRLVIQGKGGTIAASKLRTNMTHKNAPVGSDKHSDGQSFFWPVYVSVRARLITLPADFWARILLICFGLILAKCGLLFAIQKELYQIHGRFEGRPLNWLNYVTFYVFVAMVGGNLWVFGKKCALYGNVAARWATAVVAGMATAFICLRFYEGDRNYLSPVLDGTLHWGDLGSYFSMNLFFRPPFLAVWIIGTICVYYFMLRTGRERYMVQVIAVESVAYLVLNLQELRQYGSELLVLCGLGLVTAVYGAVQNRALKWPLTLIPVVLMGSVFVLFASFEKCIAKPQLVFVVLVIALGLVFALASVIAWRIGFYAGWSWLLPFAVPVFLLLLTANFGKADNYRSMILNGSTKPPAGCVGHRCFEIGKPLVVTSFDMVA